jgi:aldehyde dehydrogenase (NAD+)
MKNIQSIIEHQRIYFSTGETKKIPFRIEKLQLLKTMIIENNHLINNALKEDLNKSEFESYTTEIGFVLSEISFTLKHLQKWTKPKKVRTPITHFGSKSYVYKEPYGISVIISPWNYPLNLALAPLVGAIAAGNCAIIKPSELTPATSNLLENLIKKYFQPEYIIVIEGAAEVGKALLDEDVDFIFFTGSVNVGKIVMEAAAKHLTPVTLELGGKSPCIVHRDAKTSLAAKRIVWGKLLNAGQTCIAPDYLLVHESMKEQLIDEIKGAIRQLYGTECLLNENFPKIVHERHLQRLANMIERTKGSVVYGGKMDIQSQKMEPTIITDVEWDDPSMEEEIFGPILPIITYSNIDDAIREITKRAKPLALYLFTEDENINKKVISTVSFGSGCINDTVFQIASPYLPFGGVGPSGTGSYHGKKSFDTFSHEKSILKQTTKMDIPLRYPNVKNGLKLVRKIMK